MGAQGKHFDCGDEWCGKDREAFESIAESRIAAIAAIAARRVVPDALSSYTGLSFREWGWNRRQSRSTNT